VVGYDEVSRPERGGRMNRIKMVILSTLLLCSTSLSPDAARQGTQDMKTLLYLNGNDGHVELPSGITFGLSKATVEVWVKWMTFNKWSRVFDFGRKDNAAVLQNVKKSSILNFSIFDRSSTRHGIATGKPLEQGRWYHIAAVSGPSGMRFYVDGILVGTNSYTGSLHEASDGKNYIGRSNWEADELFHGYMTELRIWDTSRSQSEIRESMYTQIQGNSPHLVGYWRFDNTADGMVNDLSPNTNDAILIGGAAIFTATGPPIRKVVEIKEPPAQAAQAEVAEEGQSSSPKADMASYRLLYIAALDDRKVDEKERTLLGVMRGAFEFPASKVKKLEREVRKELGIGPVDQEEEIYFKLLETAYADDMLTNSEVALLNTMKLNFEISDERELELKKELSAPKPTPSEPLPQSIESNRASGEKTMLAQTAVTPKNVSGDLAKQESRLKAEAEKKSKAEAEGREKAEAKIRSQLAGIWEGAWELEGGDMAGKWHERWVLKRDLVYERYYHFEPFFSDFRLVENGKYKFENQGKEGIDVIVYDRIDRDGRTPDGDLRIRLQNRNLTVFGTDAQPLGILTKK